MGGVGENNVVIILNDADGLADVADPVSEIATVHDERSIAHVALVWKRVKADDEEWAFDGGFFPS